MEGIHQLSHTVAAPSKRAPHRGLWRASWSGYALAALVAALDAIIAIVGGVLVRNILPLPAAAVDAAKGLARRLIPLTIVLTGAGLNLARVASVGSTALANQKRSNS